MDVAFCTFHVMVEIDPATIVVGDAVKVIVGGWLTVTVTLADELPPGPLAVKVYVVVAAGETS
jgi:hypothetical protein